MKGDQSSNKKIICNEITIPGRENRDRFHAYKFWLARWILFESMRGIARDVSKGGCATVETGDREKHTARQENGGRSDRRMGEEAKVVGG